MSAAAFSVGQSPSAKAASFIRVLLGEGGVVCACGKIVVNDIDNAFSAFASEVLDVLRRP